MLTARNEARGLEAVEGVRRSGSGGQTDVVFHQLDVTDPGSVGRLVDFVRDQFGRLDILVCIYTLLCALKFMASQIWAWASGLSYCSTERSSERTVHSIQTLRRKVQPSEIIYK